MAAVQADAAADEIRQLARTYQYDRYLAALLAPRRHRDALIVLAAFAGELQRIPFAVSEPMMAAVRLQWWRDELAAAAAPNAGSDDGRRAGHPLCDALVEVAGAHRLPFGLLQGMIDAAETELDATPFAEAAETRQMLAKFDGALFELAVRVLSGADLPRDLWADVAVAYGGARLAGEAAWRRKAGVQTFVSREAARGDAQDAVILSTASRAALDAVRGRYRELDRAALHALLPLATVQPLLRAVAMPSQQSDETIIGLSDFARARVILWAHWRGRV